MCNFKKEGVLDEAPLALSSELEVFLDCSSFELHCGSMRAGPGRSRKAKDILVQ